MWCIKLKIMQAPRNVYSVFYYFYFIYNFIQISTLLFDILNNTINNINIAFQNCTLFWCRFITFVFCISYQIFTCIRLFRKSRKELKTFFVELKCLLIVFLRHSKVARYYNWLFEFVIENFCWDAVHELRKL